MMKTIRHAVFAMFTIACALIANAQEYPTKSLRIIVPFLAGIALFALLATHWLVLDAGFATSLVLLLLMKSYVELVRVMSDMLLPK